MLPFTNLLTDAESTSLSSSPLNLGDSCITLATLVLNTSLDICKLGIERTTELPAITPILVRIIL